MSTSSTPRTDAEQLELENQEMRNLLAEWVSIEPEKCRSDHHGVCYEHSHFDLPCPVARAREILSRPAVQAQHKKVDLLRGLLSMVRESKSGNWRVSLDYDNYHDGARILDGDGEMLGNCYDSPPTEIAEDWDGEEISAWQFEQAIDRAIKSENVQTD